MSLRTRIFVISTFIVLIVVSITIFLLVQHSKTKKITQTQTSTSTALNDTSSFTVIDKGNFNSNSSVVVENTTSPTINQPKVFDALAAQKNNVLQRAKIFVERYGSYSTDNNFANIFDVQDMVTPDLWAKIKPTGSRQKNGQFTGVTTEVKNMELSAWSDSQTQVKMKTVRVEDKNGIITSRQQAVTVDLVKQGSTWLVNRLAWE